MIVGAPNRVNTMQLEITIDNVPLESVAHFKYLGLYLDKNLTWKTHVDYLASKVSKRIALLGRLRKFLRPDTLSMLYKSLVLPQMDYCDIIWENYSQFISSKV